MWSYPEYWKLVNWRVTEYARMPAIYWRCWSSGFLKLRKGQAMSSKFPEVRIVRSDKREKTLQARMVDGILEVRAPANMSDEEIAPFIEKFQKRMTRRKARGELDDTALGKKAAVLNRQYFDGKLSWESIHWVTNQDKRYGSCTPAERTIRISHRLASVPAFVLDFVIVHELAHLLEANHGPRFWKLVNRYPKTERARGYLMALGLEALEE
jgi:predicted metal-dependent hydrolase